MSSVFAQDYPSLVSYELCQLDFVVDRRKAVVVVFFLAKPFSMRLVVDASNYPLLRVSTKTSFQELNLRHGNVQMQFSCPKCKKLFNIVYLRKSWVCNVCAGLKDQFSDKQLERDLEQAKKIIYYFAPEVNVW